MSHVVLFTTRTCPFCISTKALFKRKGVTHVREIAVDGSPEKRAEMTRLTGRRTVPQIFIGDTYVGGFMELAQLEKAGKLDALLAK